MQRYAIWLLALGMGLCAPDGSATEPPAPLAKVVIAADFWCPYNCEPGSVLPGYMVEVAREAFALGDALTPRQVEYRVLPWARAKMYARKGKIQAIVGALASEAEQLILPQENLGYSSAIFFTLRDDTWQFSGIEALSQERRKIGAIRDYDYSDEFVSFHEAHPQRVHLVHGEDPLRELIRLLRLQKIDAIVEDPSVFYFMLKSLGIPRQDFRSAGMTGKLEALYIAFNDQGLADQFDTGVRQLRDSGRLAEILAKYNLVDWQTPSAP